MLSAGNTATSLLEKIKNNGLVFWDKWIKIVVNLDGNGKHVYRYECSQEQGKTPSQRLFGALLTDEEAERWGLTKTGEIPLNQLPTKVLEKTLNQTIQLWFKRRYDHLGGIHLLTPRRKPGEKEVRTGLRITTKKKRGKIYITTKVVGLLLNPLPKTTPPETPLLWRVNIYNGPTAKLLRYIPPRCEVVMGEKGWVLPSEDIYLHPCYHNFKPTEALKLRNRITADAENIVSQVKNTIVGNNLFGCHIENRDVDVSILPHTEQEWTTKLLGVKVVVSGDIISDDHGLILLAHHFDLAT
ncbi:MAG: hypothetical protein DRO11_06170 [Methanobacteriota archaeon]|nr:MAG: hypothetical protein DRO11_06170 [Euryarchaeota archaeon]